MRPAIIFLLACLLLASCGRREMERARQNLLLLAEQNRCDTVFRSDTLQLSLAKHFERHGTRGERMLAYYLLGRARHDMGETPSAIDCYQQAADCADTTAADCDYDLLARIYSQQALLFHLQGLPSQEREALTYAERYAWKAGDTLMAIGARGNQIGSCYLEGKYDEVIRICKWASTEYEKAGYKADAARALFSVIHIYVERGNFAEAIPPLERFEKESGCVCDGESVPGLELYYYEKGMVETYLNHHSRAESYFRKLLTDRQNYNNLQAGYKGLLTIYEKHGARDSVSKYARLYAAATDSSYKGKQTEEVARMNALYRYDRAKMETQQAKERLRRTYYTSSIIFVLLLLSLLWSYQRMKLKRERMRHLLHMENQRYLQLLSEYQAASNAVSKLTEENTSQREYYQTRLNELRSKLASYLGKDMNEADWSETPNLSSTPIVLQFHKYAATLHTPTSKDWKELYRVCERRYPNFLSAINNFTKHDLTVSEKQICLLFIMQFTKSETGILLDISPQSLTNYCARINKRLFHIAGAKGLEFNIRNMKKRLS